MKIKVCADNIKINLAVPNWLIISRAGLKALKKSDNKMFDGIKPKHLRKIRKTVKRMKKLHGDWSLITVDIGDERTVELKI